MRGAAGIDANVEPCSLASIANEDERMMHVVIGAGKRIVPGAGVTTE